MLKGKKKCEKIIFLVRDLNYNIISYALFNKDVDCELY